MRGKTQFGNVVSSHSSACGAQLLDDEAVDRLAELVMLVGEDEVPARAGVVGLQDIGGGHDRNRTVRSRVTVSACAVSSPRASLS